MSEVQGVTENQFDTIRPPSMWLPAVAECVPGFDAAYLPDPAPAGYAWCMVYAGGTAALHPWPDADVDRAIATGYRLLPAWVPAPGSDDPKHAAASFVTWLEEWKVPRDTPLLWDMETAGQPDAAWLNRACDITAAASGKGDLNLVYGSTGTLFGLPARSGYFPADPTGSPHLVLRPQVAGTQYRWGVPVANGALNFDQAPYSDVAQRSAAPGQVDLDVAVRELYAKMWKP